MTTPLDPRTRTAIFAVACFGAMFAVGAGATYGLRSAASVAVGALIAIANLYGLARILGAVVGSRTTPDPNPNAGIWGVLAIVKVLGLFGGVWLLMSAHLVDPVALVVGWAALPVGIAIGSLVSDKTDLPGPSHDKQAPPAPPAT
jgi:hypothetical protein